MENSRLDRYYVAKKLGEGGFGQVFLGHDEKLHRTVAIKTLPHGLTSLYEAQILAELDHPHIVRIYDIIEHNQTLYLVMEYVAHTALLKQRLSLDEILTVGIQICSALTEIHRRGIIHQDIKPENILRDPDTEQCKLTDFGIVAKTRSGNAQIIGTPKFIAPEQRQGAQVDQTADIYGLAQVLNSLLESNRIQPVPNKLRQILSKASHIQSFRRYQHASELQYELRQVQRALANWGMLEERDLRPAVRKISIFDVFRSQLPLISRIGGGVIAGLAAWLVLSSSFIADINFYIESFQSIIAPMLISIIGYFSLPIATITLAVLAIPPLLISWPSLGFIIALVLIVVHREIIRTPLLYLGMLGLAFVHPYGILVLPVIAGYHYGVLAVIPTSILPAMCYYLATNITSTNGYRIMLLNPVQVMDGRWLQAAWDRISLEEIREIGALIGNWLVDGPGLMICLLGLILGLGAFLVARRGRLGLVLYLGTTGLGIYISQPDLVILWAIAMVILLASTLVKSLVHQGSKTKQAGRTKNYRSWHQKFVKKANNN